MSEKILSNNENHKKMEEVIKYIDEHFKEQPDIDTLASYIGMSKYHFIRVFKEYVGVTPMQFLQSITLNYAKEHLKESKSILDSSLDIGLSSSSRLHDLFVKIIGVTPKEYKELGNNVELTYGYGTTPFGEALIAFTKRGVSYLGFIDNNETEVYKRFKEIWEKATFIKNDIKAQDYLNNIFLKNKKFNLYVKGSNFQINIWKALLNIPNGNVTSYTALAKSINKPKATAALSAALASNHIAYLIPCHRVLAKSGAMSGYTWGIERKKDLLVYEGAKKKQE
ncbi:MAG: methylated-DNA--[protein]-cysteine S-methyltransferase [Campylobacteraceae bacterium]|nr:methylated-DNA--[protein]-cysteine S-methyltransferase [Campylobacteraceae bacterium]